MGAEEPGLPDEFPAPIPAMHSSLAQPLPLWTIALSQYRYHPGVSDSWTRRRWTGIAFCAAGALACIGCYVIGSQVLAVRAASDDLQTAASGLEGEVAQLDASGAITNLQGLEVASARLERSTSSPVWRALEQTPGLGPAARATSTAGRVAARVSSTALPLARRLQQQHSMQDQLLTLLRAEQEIGQLRDATRDATGQLAAYQGLSLPLGVAEPIDGLAGRLSTLNAGLTALAEASTPVQHLLGMEPGQRPQRWLVMAQNPAEARGSGGLFNAYLIAEVRDGRMRIREAGSRKRLDGEFARDEQIPYLDVIDLDTANSWGQALGEWASFNLPADFPTVARLAAAGMAKRGTPIDAVLAVDPVMVQAILAGTGPVEHRGVTIDSTSAAQFFTKDLYRDFPEFGDVQEKDELAMGLTYATIEAALNRPLDLKPLWSQASEAIASGHLRAWSSDPATQAWLETTPVSGSLASRPDDLLVTFNNGTGGKLDAYARTDVVTDTSTCAASRRVRTTVTMVNQAPVGLPDYVDLTLGSDGQPDPTAPKGQTITYVTAYPPRGWRLAGSMINGSPQEPWAVSEAGRVAWSVPVTLQRGQRATLVFTWAADHCVASQHSRDRAYGK